MRSAYLIPLVALVAGACASGGGGGGPVLHYAPTAQAAQYEVNDFTSMVMEVPGMGAMETGTTMDADLSVEVTDASAEGGVAITINAFSVESESPMQPFSHDGGSLVGQTARGYFGPEEGLVVTTRPEVPSDLSAVMDPVSWIRGLFPALPSDPNATQWPHRFETTDDAAIEVTTIFEGQARFAGDTVVNGRAGRIIISEGVAEFSGSGQPDGAPGPVDLLGTSTFRAVYVWDHAAGLMISAAIEADGSGSMSTMGMDIPVAMTSEIAVARKN